MPSSIQAAIHSSPKPFEETMPASGGRVAVKVDDITRPGSVVSGSVHFQRWQKSGWYLDQLGRLGMVPDEQGIVRRQATSPNSKSRWKKS